MNTSRNITLAIALAMTAFSSGAALAGGSYGDAWYHRDMKAGPYVAHTDQVMADEGVTVKENKGQDISTFTTAAAPRKANDQLRPNLDFLQHGH